MVTIELKEMRIGNWYVFDEEPVQFSFSDMKDLEFEEGYIGDPIPLTEEWLVKFGFEKEGDWAYYVDYYYKDYVVYIFNDNSQPKMHLDYRGGEQIELGGVDYVHQLQNLYFSLTGEEIKIKELA